MHAGTIIFLSLVLIAGSSILYKVYLEDKINHPEKKGDIGIFFLKAYNITALFPLNTKRGDTEERKTRRKANILLLLFYMCFITILIISKFLKNS